MQEKEEIMSNIKDRLSVTESELNDAYAKLDNFKNSAEKAERELKLEVSRMGKSYEVAAREKDISDRRNEDAKLEEAKEKLKGFEDLLKNKDVLVEKVLELEKILKNRNEVVESSNNELSESRRRLEENALLQKEFYDKTKKSEKLAEQKQGGIEGLNNTIQSKTTAMTSLSDEIFEKEKQLKAVIADKLVFEKKANDCEKIIEEQCCQLASLTKELECAKGLAEDTSLRLSEYESKTQKLEGILRILKDEHCEKYAELKEASDNLIVANKKNNSLAEALSEYELKKTGKDELNERLKETARSDIQNLESQLASLQNDLDSSRTASGILEEMLHGKNLESKSQRDEIEQLKNEVRILKEEKNIIEFELTKTRKVVAEKEEEILRRMQLEKEVKSLYESNNELKAESLTKTESILRDIEHLKDTEKVLKEEKNVMELDKTTKLLIKKEDEKKLLEKEVRSLNERNYDLEADSLNSNKIIKERDYRLVEVEAENSALKNSQNSLLEYVKSIKVGKDMLDEPLKESEKDVALAASGIQNLQIKLGGLQNELDSSQTASNLLEDMIRSKDLEVKSQRDDIDQLKNQMNDLMEEKNGVELELVRTRKLLAEK
ncbi:hypothetical protein QYM36_004854 [Artemia franciscana]|uniref:Uncharacterized protein n=1 Tax=Artemia franciscana TaxID=6661 RepID=A0AA88L6V5_ARTSF|nr:hypothetical protein QYM36_004854 [Artemia franciscana]